MPELWMPGVTVIASTRTMPAMRGTGEKIFTHHTMECGYDWSATSAANYLIREAKEAHFTFHPQSGEIVQLIPADVGARTLVWNALTKTPTNTHGTIHMQIEVIGYANRPWTLDLTPAGLNAWNKLMDYLRSWGIPDRWVTGRRPPVFPGPDVPKEMPMYGQSGHSFHAEWQDNNHGDPGAIADPWSFTAGTSTKPDYATAVVIQTYLHLMGYDLGSWGIDGSFGAVSLAALQQYRTDFGLPGTGYPSAAEVADYKDENVAKIDTIIANQEAIKTELTVLKSGMTALSALGTLSTLPEDIENLKQYIDTKLVTVAKSDQVVYLHEATTNQFLSLSADLEVIETKIEELQKLQAQLKTVTNDLGGMVANMTTVLGDDHDQLKAAIEEPRTISLELT